MKRGLKRKAENSFGSYSLANKKINMAARVIQVSFPAMELRFLKLKFIIEGITIYCAIEANFNKNFWLKQ
jgi:hypothetical protein